MKYQLVISAFHQTYGKEDPEAGLIVYTDQGAKFTSGNFQMLLRERDMLFTAKAEKEILMTML